MEGEGKWEIGGERMSGTEGGGRGRKEKGREGKG